MLWDDDEDGVEIGGKTVTPTNFRYYGDETLAKKYIGRGQKILGGLKQQMDLGGLKSHYDEKILDDGTKIQVRSNMWGLSDIDDIWIDVSELTSEKVKDQSLGFIARVISQSKSGTVIIESIRFKMSVIEPFKKPEWRELEVSDILSPSAQETTYSPALDGNYFINNDGVYSNNNENDVYLFYGGEETHEAIVDFDIDGNPIFGPVINAVSPFDTRQRYDPVIRMMYGNYFKDGNIIAVYDNQLLSRLTNDPAYNYKNDPAYDSTLFYPPHTKTTITAFGTPGMQSYRSAYNTVSYGATPLNWNMFTVMTSGAYEIEFSAFGEYDFDIDIKIIGSQYPSFKASTKTSFLVKGDRNKNSDRYIINIGKSVDYVADEPNPYVDVIPR